MFGFLRLGGMRILALIYIVMLLALAAACGGPDGSHNKPLPTPVPPRPAPAPHRTGVIPGEQRMAERMTVIFDQPMRMPRGTDGLSTPPLRFKPALDGTFTTGTNFIHFVPRGLPVQQVVEVELHPGLVSEKGAALPEVERRFYRTTFDFRPDGVARIDQTTTATTFSINFPVQVTTQSLQTRLEVLDRDGKPASFTLGRGSSEYSVHLVLATETAWPARVTVKQGLPDAQNRVASIADATYSISAQEQVPIVLRVNGLDWRAISRERQAMGIQFSEPVMLAELMARLSVTDLSGSMPTPLPFTLDTQTTGATNYVAFSFAAPDPANLKIRVQLPAELESESGVKLGSPYLEDRALRSQFSVTSTNWESGGREGIRLELGVSQGVALEALKQRLTLEPALENMLVSNPSSADYDIAGDWRLDTNYKLTIGPGLKFAGWNELTTAVTVTVRTPKEGPRFLGVGDADKIYIPRRFGNAVPLETRGVKQVKATLYRMFPSNIALAVEAMNDRWSIYQFQDRWSEQIAERKIALADDGSKLMQTALAIDKLTSAPMTGIFGLRVSDEQGQRTQNRLLLMSNLGLLARWKAGELILYAHDLFTLAPAQEAKVTVYSYKNQILGTVLTDAEGIARLTGFAEQKGRPTVAVVEQGADYTFLALDHRHDEVPEAVQRAGAGLDPYNAKGYDAAMYADRELYRPGETVHLRWIVRQNYGDAVAGAPFLLRVIKPNGKYLIEQAIELSEWGTASLDVPTEKTHETGAYTAQLTVPGDDTEVGHYDFRLEEFVPNRMKAALNVPAERWVAGEGARKVTLKAEQLFGGPAAGRVASLMLTLSSGVEFPEWPQFTFASGTEPSFSPVQLGEATTDAEGNATFEIADGALPASPVPLRVRLNGRVQELGGRAVPAAADAQWFPSAICIGIRAEAAENGEIAVQAIALTPEGKPAALPQIDLALERQNWTYGVRSYRGYNEPIWSGDYTRLETRTVATRDGMTSTTFNAAEFGYYRVVASSPLTPQFSALTFFTYNGKPRPASGGEPEYIKLKLDRERYAVGERARLRIDSAFAGKALIVLQNDHFRRELTADVTDQGTEIELELGAELAPTAWVEAHVIHAVDENKAQVYPFTSFTAIPLRVEQPARRIQITMPGLPEESLPERGIDVRIETRDGNGEPVAAEVTLAAVDEGIHGITGYKSPDPTGYLARLRWPELMFAHYYDKIASKFTAPSAPGDDGSMARRLGRSGKSWIRTVSLWSGAVRTDTAGQATIRLELPDFDGQLRLDAVAANATATGVATQRLYVRRPFMLQTSLPRFMLPGDKATLTGTLINTTASTATGTLDWRTSGTLISTSGTATLAMRARGEATTTTTIEAAQHSGQGEVRWGAEIKDAAGNTTSTLTLAQPLYVGEPAVYQTSTTLRVIRPGESVTFAATGFAQDDWTNLHLTVGASPLLRLKRALDGVMGYPYGCVEQTTSKLLTLYLLRKQQGLLASGGVDVALLNSYIESGIARLWTMQTADGGLAFWPGGQGANAYGSVYALHFLTLARNGREYRLGENDYAALSNYVRQIARGTAGSTASSSGLYQRAYAVYVLSMAGDAEALALIDAMHPMGMPRPARYLLAAALATNTQDIDRVKLYLQSGPEPMPWTSYEYGGTLNSPVRANAVELLALVQMKGEAGKIAGLADELARELETRRYLTTQEQAFIITALSAYLDSISAQQGPGAARITWNSGETTIGEGDVFHRKIEGAGVSYTVENTGGASLFATAVAAGVPLQAAQGAFMNNIAVGRRVLDRDGNPAAGPYVQGRSYIVELEIDTRKLAENVVLADLLPAGFEIENPRLNLDAATGMRLPYAVSDPDHLELRDDRLILSWSALSPSTGNKAENRSHFYYVVNAVTPGEFRWPGARIELMYDPATRGNSAAERISIVAREQAP